MTPNADPPVADYSGRERNRIPPEHTWKIEDLYADEPAWEAERREVTRLAATIEEQLIGWTASSGQMRALFRLVDEINRRLSRLYLYGSLQSDTEMSVSRFQVMKGEIQSLSVEVSARLASLESDIIALGGERFTAYLQEEPALAEHRFQVESTLRQRDHILPGDQERILSLAGLFTDTPERAAGMLTNLDIPPAEITLSSGETVALTPAAYMRHRVSPVTGDRRLVMRTFWTNQRQYLNTIAVLLDGAAKQHLFEARVRRFDDCLKARLFREDIDPGVYQRLIETVKEDRSPLHRYLNLKKDLLDLGEYTYDDIYASAAAEVRRTYPFPAARELIREALSPLGGAYTDLIERACRERWIDIYPNRGKQSGAYVNNTYGVHPYIKLNHIDDFNSVTTFAHELGHAIHSNLADARQPFATAQYSLFLAEIASTFNENLLLHHLLKNEPDDRLKLFLLDGYLEQIRATLFRQTLFAEFELDLHRRVEAGQTLTPDWLSERYLELTRCYYGHDLGVTRVDDHIGAEWSWIPHFYYNFYVFQYSTGIAASLALSDRVLHGGEAERSRYLEMLAAGGSDYPLAILRRAGVDMTSAEPFRSALHRFDSMVGEMEAIATRLKTRTPEGVKPVKETA